MASIVAVLLLFLEVVDATKASGGASTFLVGDVTPVICNLGDALREIDMDAVVVDEHAFHFEVGLFALLLGREFNECVLQAVACVLVPDDLAVENLAKARENELEILILRDGVEFAHKEDVFWRRNFSKWEVADHLERQGLGARLSLSAHLFQRLGVVFLVELLIVGDSDGGELCGRRGRALWRLHEAGRVVVGVVEDDGVQQADVLERLALVVDVGRVDLFERVEALDDGAKDGRLGVEEVDVGGEGDDELAAGQTLVGVVWVGGRGHADGAHAAVLQPGTELGHKRLAGGVGGVEQPPDGAAAITVGGVGAEGVARLEGEVWLDAVHGGKVVVFCLAELDEAARDGDASTVSSC